MVSPDQIGADYRKAASGDELLAEDPSFEDSPAAVEQRALVPDLRPLVGIGRCRLDARDLHGPVIDPAAVKEGAIRTEDRSFRNPAGSRHPCELAGVVH